jgi:hypothetical protein
MVELFESLFGQHGHVYKFPRYKKDTGTYEWIVQVILDKSFEFLLEARDKCREWVARQDSTMLAYLAGLVDAEGYIRIYPNPRTIGITVTIYNTDTELLGFAHLGLTRLGHRPMRLYLHRGPGKASSGFQIELKKAEWRVMIGRFDEAQSLLRRLPLRHREKVGMKELSLSVNKGDLYEKIGDKVRAFRNAVDQEVAEFTKQAETEYLRTHPIKSSPVLCFPQRDVLRMGLDEHIEKMLVSERGYLAVHVEELCLQNEPCVMICPGCDEGNIVSILVHESIHHALMWMSDEPAFPLDPLDEIARLMRKRGLSEQGF